MGLLQRLYSNFANGWPGRGLLLLRLALAVFLIDHCLASRSLRNSDSWLSAIAVFPGILLLLGSWTPIAAIAAAFLEFWLALRAGDAAHFLAGAIALGLAGLGPGAWSMDARLFGRKRMPTGDLK